MSLKSKKNWLVTVISKLKNESLVCFTGKPQKKFFITGVQGLNTWELNSLHCTNIGNSILSKETQEKIIII